MATHTSTTDHLAAIAKTTAYYTFKTIWYTSVTVTCPIWFPIFSGCYAWGVHHNGRPNSPKRAYRNTQRHKRNRKLRARPLLLPRDSIGAAETTVKRCKTNSQRQSLLFTKLPPEVRSLIWDALFEDLDVHAHFVPSTSSTCPHFQSLLLFPCLDHAFLAHSHFEDISANATYEMSNRALYDLECWPRSRIDAKTAWPKDKRTRNDLAATANIFQAVRVCRLMQLEMLKAVARNVNAASGWLYPYSSMRERLISSYLPVRNQRVISCILSTKTRYERAVRDTHDLVPHTRVMSHADLYGPMLHRIHRLKLVVVDFRRPPCQRGQPFNQPGALSEWLIKTVEALVKVVRELDVVVTDVRESDWIIWKEGWVPPRNCRIRFLRREGAPDPTPYL